VVGLVDVGWFVLRRLAWEGHGDAGRKTYPHLFVFLWGYCGVSWAGGIGPGDGSYVFKNGSLMPTPWAPAGHPNFPINRGEGEGVKGASGGTDGRQGEIDQKLECSK